MRINPETIAMLAKGFETEESQRILRSLYRSLEGDIDTAKDHRRCKEVEFLSNLREQVENPDFWMTLYNLLRYEFRF